MKIDLKRNLKMPDGRRYVVVEVGCTLFFPPNIYLKVNRSDEKTQRLYSDDIDIFEYAKQFTDPPIVMID